MGKEFYQNPPLYEAVRGKVHEIKRQYQKAATFSFAKSVLGRKIYALGLGNLKNPTLLAGAFHGQEWLTTLLLFRFFEGLCECYSRKLPYLGVDLEKIFDERGVLVVPLVNPDGVEIALNGAKSAKHLKNRVAKILASSDRSWQANANGVDLNHNFDAGFDLLRKMETEQGICGPSPRQYGGRCPESEPETRAMVNLCKAFDVKKVLAFHSQGEEIYYAYGHKTPKNARLLADALAASCGYTVCSPEGLASHGGFKDWFIEHTGRPGFTIEIGKGENPLPIEELSPIYARLSEMMLLSIIM